MHKNTVKSLKYFTALRGKVLRAFIYCLEKVEDFAYNTPFPPHTKKY